MRTRWNDLVAEVAEARARRGTGRRAPRGVKRKTTWPRKPRDSRAETVEWEIRLVESK